MTYRGRVFALLVTTYSAGACFAWNDDPHGTRVLETSCGASADGKSTCKLVGSAHVVRGITDDATGIRIGPGAGSVIVSVPTKYVAGTSTRESTSLELLVRGRGTYVSCVGGQVGSGTTDGSCASHAAVSDYEWTTVASGMPPFSIQVADDGSWIEIADAAVPKGCSVAVVGRR